MNFSVYLTIDPSWLTYPALLVFWLGVMVVAVGAYFAARWTLIAILFLGKGDRK